MTIRFPIQPIVRGSRPLRFQENMAVRSPGDLRNMTSIVDSPVYTNEEKEQLYMLLGGTVEGLMRSSFCTEETRRELDNEIAKIDPDYLRHAVLHGKNSPCITGKVRCYETDAASLAFLWDDGERWNETTLSKNDAGQWFCHHGRVPAGWLMVRA